MSKKQTSGHPDAKRPRGHILAWINMALVCIIVLCCNYIGCHEYGHKDLTLEHRFTLSDRSKNLLSSGMVQKHEAPIRIIFAFMRSTPNYNNMLALLEEYKLQGNGKIEVEFFDPIREPNRARDFKTIYGRDFDHNLCVVDARKNTRAQLKPNDSERSHVHFLEGKDFVKYSEAVNGQPARPVSLQMDSLLSSAIVAAVEGQMRRMVVIEGKGGVSDKDLELLGNLDPIMCAHNIEYTTVTLKELGEYLDDEAAQKSGKNSQFIEGVLILGPTSDFTNEEIDVLRRFWERDGYRNSIFVALNPEQRELPVFFRFLRELGIRPNKDRVLLRDQVQTTGTGIPALIPDTGVDCLKDYRRKTPQVGGMTMSFELRNDDEGMATTRKLTSYHLLVTNKECYGERSLEANPRYNPDIDLAGPLNLLVAVTRGTQEDRDNDNFSTILVMGNTDILHKGVMTPEMQDYLDSVWGWMISRPQYTGKGGTKEIHPKIELNRHSQHVLQILTMIIMPLLSLLVALCLWNIRRH